MNKLRVVFMGTPEFAIPSLKMLIEEGYPVPLVITQPDKPKGRGNKLASPPVKQFCLDRGINLAQPLKIRDDAFVSRIEDIGPEVIVTAAYGRILPGTVLRIPRYGCVNVHASLLPKYRGAAPISRAVINGEATTGITTIFMDEGMDTGDILMKTEIPVGPDMTAGELGLALSSVGAEVLKQTLIAIGRGEILRMPQNRDEATYAPVLTKEDGIIDWNADSKTIHNLVRGTNPWPIAFTFLNGRRMRVYKTAIPDKTDCDRLEITVGRPGTIAKASKDGIYVICGKGLLKILDIQFDSGKMMNAAECWHNFNEGEKFTGEK